MKGLHALNSLRVPLIREGLISTGKVTPDKINKPNVLEGLKCIEIGCGAGILTEALARLKAEIVGIDLSSELIEVAKNHASENLKINYMCKAIENVDLKNHFDAVIISEVLEHIDDKKSFLKASIETLKPGGSIFITTFNKTPASFIGGIIAAEFILNLLPKHTHEWDKFIDPLSLQKILLDNDCQTLLIHGFNYNFINDTMNWQKNVDINYALHAIKHS